MRPSHFALPLVAAAVVVGCDDPQPPGLRDAAIPSSDGGSEKDVGVEPDGGVRLGQVEVSTTALSFGPVVVGSTVSMALQLRNPADAPLEVSFSPISGAAEGGFDRLGAERLTLAPSEQRSVELLAAPTAAGPWVATFALDSCGGACPSAILLAVEGVDAGTRCQPRIDFGLVNVGACAEASLRCENVANLNESARLQPWTGSGDLTVTSTIVLQLAPQASGDWRLRYCPTDSGMLRGSFEVAVENALSAAARSVEVRGEGGGPDFACAPVELDFGIVPLNRSTVRSFSCTNRGLETGRIDVSAPDPRFNIASSTSAAVAPGQTVAFDVELVAPAPAMITGRAVVRTDDPDLPRLEVELRGEARERVPCMLRFDPANRALGRVPVGTSVAAGLNLANTGVAPCAWRGVSAQGSSDIEVNPAGGMLAPGASTVIGVRVQPTAPGTLTSTVRVLAGLPQRIEAVVSAEAAPADVVVQPRALDFGSRAVGCGPALRTVEVLRLQGTGAVTRVQLVGPGASAFSLDGIGMLPNRLEAGQSLTFSVGFDPAQAGMQRAELQVFVGPGNPFLVPLQGIGATSNQRVDGFRRSREVVDLLFVVDDSGSMAQVQRTLSSFAGRIAQRYELLQTDLHLGVVTTDLDEPSTAGVLRGNPAVLTRQSASWAGALAERLSPGTNGSGTEQGLGAAIRALTPPASTGSNAGFRRPSARLEVVIVSDEDDATAVYPMVSDAIQDLRQVASELRVHVWTGPPDRGCDGPLGEAAAAPRWAAAAALTGGVRVSLCEAPDAALETLLAAAAGPVAVPLSEEPLPSTLQVTVNGQSIPAFRPPTTPGGWAYDAAARTVRFLDPTEVPAVADVEVGYRTRCAFGTCGDLQTTGFEQCDDGNGVEEDACIDCVSAVCGDGFPWSGMEACDDGNANPNDACLPNCQTAACGDGFVETGVEDCDDGNTAPGDGCPSNCRYYSVSGPSFQLFRRLRSGTVLTFTGGNPPESEGVAQVRLPFSFDFFGVPTSTLTVSPNGVLGTGVFPRGNHWENRSFPDARPPRGVIAPWWDNLVVDPGVSFEGASVAFEVLGSAPSRTAVIQWRNVRLASHRTRAHRRWRFQVQIDEGSSEIRFHYGDSQQRGVNFPSNYSASVGLESTDGQTGVTALSCTPECDGRPRALGPNFHYPEAAVITFTPGR